MPLGMGACDMIHRVPRAEGLPRPALAFRAVHSVIATSFLFAIGYVWWCALTGRRGSLLHFAIGALLSEGALVIVNRGDCPLRPLQKRVGDPVPLFELVLSPRAAERAVPVLGAVTAAGVAVVWLREPRPRLGPAPANRPSALSRPSRSSRPWIARRAAPVR